MTVRKVTQADREILQRLWEGFTAELDEPDYWQDTWEEAWVEIVHYAEAEVALLAEDDGDALGYALARLKRPRVGYVSDLYVRPNARRRAVGKALLREALVALRERGAEVLTLNVNVGNEVARAVYRRLGFREESIDVIATATELEARLGTASAGPTFGSVHAQTDDLAGVERAMRTFVPRLGRSAGSVAVPPRNGWIAVYDELCSREPELLRRLAREFSDRFGVAIAVGVEAGQVVRYVLFDRGRMVDEYLSVPEFHGPLPPGDVIALGANPTLLQRLTGAEPARVRAVARTAASPAELPPALELVVQIGELLGLSGVDVGYEEALQLPGALRIER